MDAEATIIVGFIFQMILIPVGIALAPLAKIPAGKPITGWETFNSWFVLSLMTAFLPAARLISLTLGIFLVRSWAKHLPAGTFGLWEMLWQEFWDSWNDRDRR